MEGQGRQIGGLALCLVGVLGVCVACGLPMWRETSFTGANVVTAQLVWDGLWLHCVVQSTGQMQCRRQTSPLTATTDLQAGRGLTLLSILTGLLGLLVTLLGGGVVDCSVAPPPPGDSLPLPRSSSTAKASLLGGVLCVVSGALCAISVSWSAANTVLVYNDPLVVQALQRDVGSSVYVGGAASVLLLLGGALICSVCTRRTRSSSSSLQSGSSVYTPPYTHRFESDRTASRTAPTTTRSSVVTQKSPGGWSEGGAYDDHDVPSRAATRPLYAEW